MEIMYVTHAKMKSKNTRIPKVPAPYTSKERNMIEKMKLSSLLHVLKRNGVRLAAIAEAAGINKATIYSISAGRNTSTATEKYLRQVIAASYPSELQRIERLMTLGVLVDD